MNFTYKQAELLNRYKEGELKKFVLLDGSVRSGKTFISLVLWILFVISKPVNAGFMMVGKTLTALERNCLKPLRELAGAKNFDWNLYKKRAVLFGREIYLEGAANRLADDKIKGVTLTGAYADELSTMLEPFFVMLQSRLSVRGARLFATTNPDTPAHWLKKNYIDRAAAGEIDDFETIKFLLDDNTELPAEYVNSLKKNYSGIFYKRNVLGQWIAAEGAVYQYFIEHKTELTKPARELPEIREVYIGLDFGGDASATAAVAVGFTKGYGAVAALDEHYRKGKTTAGELARSAENFVRRLAADYRVGAMFCDSSETTLISTLKHEFLKNSVGVPVKEARKCEILQRIRVTTALMEQGRLFVTPNCPRLSEAFETAVYNPRAEGKDERLDNGTTNIDSLDAFEYAIERFIKNLIYGG
jgi:PBSX family phage terminase large subunit